MNVRAARDGVRRMLRGLASAAAVPAAAAARIVWLRLNLPAWLQASTLPDLLARLTPPDRDTARAARPADLVRGVVLGEWMVKRLRGVPDTCLYRSLARYSALRHAGVPARFFLGVRPDDTSIDGHAWVEIDGEAFRETLDARLEVTYAHPAGSSTRR